MRGLLTSVRYTVRLLRKSPTFTIIAVVILGVGIGANTAIFSLLDSVVLNPLPFPHPDRLVSVANTRAFLAKSLSVGSECPGQEHDSERAQLRDYRGLPNPSR
jgi:hypothetical protein